MVKFCLSGVWRSSPRHLLVGAVLFFMPSVQSHAASNQATAVLHIRVTVVPTVQAANTYASASNASAPVTYHLQPSLTVRMTSQVTLHQISTMGTISGVKADGRRANGGVLQTTTVVPE